MKKTLQGIIGAAVVIVAVASQGQTGSGLSVPSGAEPLTPGEIPSIGTFYFLNGPDPGQFYPPLPCPPADLSLPIYALGDGLFLVDDGDYDWSQIPSDQLAMFTPLDSSPDPCPCCSYPTNTTLKWALQLFSGRAYADLSMAPDGTLYVPDVPTGYGTNVLWAVNTSLLDTTDTNGPPPNDFANWYYPFILQGPGSSTVQTMSAVGSDGTIYVSDYGWYLHALDPVSGTDVWTFPLTEETNFFYQVLPIDPPGTLAVGADNTLYWPYNLYIFALTNAPGRITQFSSTNYYNGYAAVDNFTLTNVGIKWLYFSPNCPVSGSPTHYPYDTNFAPYSTFLASSPAVDSDGTLYVNTDQGQLFALNTNGILKWVTSQVYLTNFCNALSDVQNKSSAPIIGADGTVYYGYANYMFAINPAAHVTNEIMGNKWTYEYTPIASYNPLGGGISVPYNEFLKSPALGQDGSLYAEGVGQTNLLFAFDSATGQPKWTNTLAANPNVLILGYGSVAVACDGEIYLADWDGTVYSFCPNGNTNWTFDTTAYFSEEGYGLLGAPLIGPDGTIYVENSTWNWYGYAGAAYVYALAGNAPAACSPWPQLGKNARRSASVIPPTATGRLSLPKMTTNGFQFKVAAPTNTTEAICAATDLRTNYWLNIGQIVLTNGPAVFTDPGATNLPARFYTPFPQ